MAKYLPVVAVISSLTAVGVAHAETTYEETIQALLDHCETSTSVKPDSAAFCMRTVIGASTVMLLNCEAAKQGYASLPWLRMKGLPSNGAGRQAFINWARANPARWGDFGALGMAEALTEAFPCDAP